MSDPLAQLGFLALKAEQYARFPSMRKMSDDWHLIALIAAGAYNTIADLRAEVARPEAELADTKEVERAFETLFEARCKLLEDTKRLGLCVCKQRDETRAKLEAIRAWRKATKPPNIAWSILDRILYPKGE